MRSNAFLKSNKTALTVAPLPSVALFHECSMLIKAWVVLLPDIAPNRWESTFLRSAGFTKPSTTKSSATFDKMGVKDMGLKWLFTSRIGFCFGIGEMLSSFHDDGRRASMYEQFKMFTYIIIIIEDVFYYTVYYIPNKLSYHFEKWIPCVTYPRIASQYCICTVQYLFYIAKYWTGNVKLNVDVWLNDYLWVYNKQ